jgi:hypothetical protein
MTDWDKIGFRILGLCSPCHIMPRAGPQASSSVSARGRPGRNGPISRADETEVVSVRLIPSKMIGDLPSFNDWANHVVEGNYLYMFGGCRPSDSDPTSDFYRWDTQSMRWSNLTVRSSLSLHRDLKLNTVEERHTLLVQPHESLWRSACHNATPLFTPTSSCAILYRS